MTRVLGVVLLASLMEVAGCDGRAAFLGARDSEIEDSTQAIAAARDDGQRAKAYSSRGHAYSEKARYSRISKLIPSDEYERLFDHAIKDHDQAVTLDPGSAEVYFNRGDAYYFRGFLDAVENQSGKTWFNAAASDFEKALEKDPQYNQALDLLGLSYEQAGEEDKAIRAYTQEMARDPFGKQRLADAYCSFGFRHQQEKEYAAAAAAYQKSVEFGVADDHSCPYDPFESGIAIYTTQTHEYDKAWEILHRAQEAGRKISPRVIERLKKDSGRTD
jgi:tetratricopeptide (TPR) repeat protein